LRIYQCAFEIFDSDGNHTIDMDELLDTLEVYGKGHQRTDFYSDQIVNSIEKKHREGFFKLLLEKMLLQAKTILTATSSSRSEPFSSIVALVPPIDLGTIPDVLMTAFVVDAAISSFASHPTFLAAAAEQCRPTPSNSVTSSSSSIITKTKTSLNLEEFIVFMESVTHPGSKSSDLEVEFGSFCKNVLQVMLHTSEALGSIYRNLRPDIQKSFRSTAYLGKLCEEVPISNGEVLYSRGDNPSSMPKGEFFVVDSRVLQVIWYGEMKMACTSLEPVMNTLLTAI